MKKWLTLAILSIISMANNKITSYELQSNTKIPKDIIVSILKEKAKYDFNENVLKDLYTDFLNTGLIERINIEPIIENENVRLNLNIIDVKNIDTKLDYLKQIEDMKKEKPYTIQEIIVTGTSFDTTDFIKNSPVKVGNKFTYYDGKMFEKQFIDTGFFKYALLDIEDLGDNKIKLNLKLTENPIVKSVKIKGVSVFNEDKAIELLGIKVGKILNLNTLSNTSNLIQEYKKLGYNWIGFKDINISDDGNVDITFEELKVGSITYDSNDEYALKTKDFVLERNTKFKKGDVVNQKDIENTVKALYKTGLFLEVIPEFKKVDPKNGTVDVVFNLTERQSMSINGNLSYSNKDSIGATLSFRDENFLGQDQTLDISVTGNINATYKVNLGYKNKWIKGTDKLVVEGNIFFNGEHYQVESLWDKILNKRVTNKELQEETLFFKPTQFGFNYGLSAVVGKGFGSDFFLLGKAQFLGVQSKNKYQKYNRIENEDGTYRLEKGKKGFLYEDYNIIGLGVTGIYDIRDDINKPKLGLYSLLTVNAGYVFRDKSIMAHPRSGVIEKPVIDEDTGEFKTRSPKFYISTNVDIRGYHPIIPKYNSMAYRLIGGASHPNTPKSQLFTIGDGITMRGQLKPSSYLLGSALSIENRTYITKYFEPVLFYEVAILGKQNEDTNKIEFKLAHDAGVGVRVNSPIGILRLDYAWNLPSGNYGLDHIETPIGKFTIGVGGTF